MDVIALTLATVTRIRELGPCLTTSSSVILLKRFAATPVDDDMVEKMLLYIKRVTEDKKNRKEALC